MNKNRPRIKDIADELSLSTSTVSRALANDRRISKPVRNAVNELAKRWGYTRNIFAFNLYRKTSNNIGLILPEFTHHFFSQVLKGIDSVINEHGLHLIINTHNNDYNKEQQALTVLNSLMVEGILVAYSGNNQGFQQYQEAILNGVPIVFFDRSCEEIQASYVVTDDFSGAIAAITHLARTGCKKIAYFEGPEDLSTNFNRKMGYLEGHRRSGISFHEELTLPWDSDNDRLKISMAEFIKSAKPDGIFCFSDYIAYDALCVLESLAISVPDEISLIGFAGEPIADISRPRISTVQQPAEQLGRRAAEILIWHVTNPDDKKIITEVLPTELVLRATTKNY